MNEYVDQYYQHASVASPLSPGTAFSLQYTSSHFVVKVEYIFLIALNNVLVIHVLLLFVVPNHSAHLSAFYVANPQTTATCAIIVDRVVRQTTPVRQAVTTTDVVRLRVIIAMFSYIGLDVFMKGCSDEVIFLYKMLYIVDKLHGLKVIVISRRTLHREVCSEWCSRNPPLCN